jgi:hypothetical protein
MIPVGGALSSDKDADRCQNGEDGMVTVESAISVSAILLVVFAAALALLAVASHVRCVDAAREAARLAARGDDEHARSSAQAVAPPGALVSIDEGPDIVTATVTFHGPIFSVDLGAKSVAAKEPVAGP